MKTDMLSLIWEYILFIVFFLFHTAKGIFITCKTFFLMFVPTPRKNIADDVILITGGGRGIGRQMAIKFAKHRPRHIVLLGRNETPLKETEKDVQSLGVQCTYYICDVCNRDLVYKIAEDIKQNIGDVTILVNNAGIFKGGLFSDESDEDIQKTFAINALAHIWTYKAFLPGMIKQERGHIVTISSMLGMMSLKGATSYCSSKFATTGMSEALFLELQEYPNIHLTSIHSYQVANDMFKDLELRFPWLIPPLPEDYVADCTIKAVLTNKKVVMMPRIMYLLVPCLSLFPAKSMVPLFKFLGVSSALDGLIIKKTQKTE